MAIGSDYTTGFKTNYLYVGTASGGVWASADFETTLQQLRQLIEVDLRNLEKQMEAAGAPWTPGRIPEWKPEP